MIYREEFGDLFEVDPSYMLAQCISADFAMGKGIAVEFNNRFDTKNQLKNKYPQYLQSFIQNGIKGDCIAEGRVLNLITKERYYQKPTYTTMTAALEKMKDYCLKNGISKIAMPLIGCGLDRLNWASVRNIIQSVFFNVNIEILVCKQ